MSAQDVDILIKTNQFVDLGIPELKQLEAADEGVETSMDWIFKTFTTFVIPTNTWINYLLNFLQRHKRIFLLKALNIIQRYKYEGKIK